MSRRHREDHRGFVVLAALVVLVLVAAAIAALTVLVSADGHRTLNLNNDAQLEQLLLAGAAEASPHLAGLLSPAAGQSWIIELPSRVAPQNASLRTSIESVQSDGQVAVLIVRARFNERSAEQTLHFSRASGDWKLVSAELGAG